VLAPGEYSEEVWTESENKSSSGESHGENQGLLFRNQDLEIPVNSLT